MFTCKIDNAEFDTLDELKTYIRKVHRIKLERYFVNFDPKLDLLTGEIIEFKNPEFYNSVLFNNRDNLLKFFKQNKGNATLLTDVTKRAIKLRQDAKCLKFAPSTFECKTAVLPSPYLCYHFGVDYNKICTELGLICRYDYKQDIKFKNISLEIIKDTREQLPLGLNAKITKSKLDVGDYACKNNYNGFVVERKSLSDLINTNSGGYERFIEEIERAKDQNTYVVVLCEEKLENLINFKPEDISNKMKATSSFICRRIKSIYEKYDHIQYVFAENRIVAGRLMERLFKIQNNIRHLDLQFLLETEKI